VLFWFGIVPSETLHFPLMRTSGGFRLLPAETEHGGPIAPFGGLRADTGTEGPGGPEKGRGSFTKALRTGELQNEAKHGGRDPFVFL
jgi:hypothetical protein